jgi:DNA-directed RNA polymerase subunit RPC12/RpoP
MDRTDSIYCSNCGAETTHELSSESQGGSTYHRATCQDCGEEIESMVPDSPQTEGALLAEERPTRSG